MKWMVKKELRRIFMGVAVIFTGFLLSTAFAGTLVMSHSHAKTHKNILVEASKTIWFEQGNPSAKHALYVIADPNCSACHYLYESLRPYINSGYLKVRWVMTAFLKPSSLEKSATILSSGNPAVALDQNESNFNTIYESGGIVSKKHIPRGSLKEVIHNTNFMIKHHYHRTPIILFKSKSGKINILRGAPEAPIWPRVLPYIAA